jgi:hypothetical protein
MHAICMHLGIFSIPWVEHKIMSQFCGRHH